MATHGRHAISMHCWSATTKAEAHLRGERAQRLRAAGKGIRSSVGSRASKSMGVRSRIYPSRKRVAGTKA